MLHIHCTWKYCSAKDSVNWCVHASHMLQHCSNFWQSYICPHMMLRNCASTVCLTKSHLCVCVVCGFINTKLIGYKHNQLEANAPAHTQKITRCVGSSHIFGIPCVSSKHVASTLDIIFTHHQWVKRSYSRPHTFTKLKNSSKVCCDSCADLVQIQHEISCDVLSHNSKGCSMLQTKAYWSSLATLLRLRCICIKVSWLRDAKCMSTYPTIHTDSGQHLTFVQEMTVHNS